MLQLAIIGYGYWGKNLVRNFYNTPDCKIALVADTDVNKLRLLSHLYPSIPVTTQVSAIFDNTAIDAVIIATPVSFHYSLAKQALLAGKHVLVEKPLTTSVNEASELIELAQKYRKVLMVDHTFLYTGAVEKIKKLIQGGELGKINYIDSTRINLGLFQPDINVLWDLAPHDIAICLHLLNEIPYSVQANGISHTSNGIENIAYITLNYSTALLAHFTCSWLSPVKLRQMLIGGDKKMIVYNDMEPTEKVKIYDTGFAIATEDDISRVKIDYRTGDIYIPKLATTEALAGMAADFIQAVLFAREPVSNWKLGLMVVKILEGASKSIKARGKEVVFIP